MVSRLIPACQTFLVLQVTCLPKNQSDAAGRNGETSTARPNALRTDWLRGSGTLVLAGLALFQHALRGRGVYAYIPTRWLLLFQLVEPL